MSACCPFHSEKSPSFTVSPPSSFIIASVAARMARAIGFVMEHQGLGFVEAVEDLARSAGMTVPKEESGRYEHKTEGDFDALSEAMQHATHYYRDELKRSEAAIDYLKKRGLSGEIAARFGIGYAPGGWQNLASGFSRLPGESPGAGGAGDRGRRQALRPFSRPYHVSRSSTSGAR